MKTPMMDDALPASFDLGPIMRALLRRKDRQALAAGNALKNYRDARSAFHDLAYAVELADHLEKTDPINGSPDFDSPVSIRGACLYFGILLYIRAGERSQRRGLNLKSHLNEEDTITHRKFEKLRDKGIAHFDYERPFGDESVADDVLVVIHKPEGGQRLDFADRRVTSQVKMEKQFIGLVRAAIAPAREQVSKLDADVNKHLLEVTRGEPTLGRLIAESPFDAVGFFGEEQTARRFLLLGTPHDDYKKLGVLFEGLPKVGDFAE